MISCSSCDACNQVLSSQVGAGSSEQHCADEAIDISYHLLVVDRNSERAGMFCIESCARSIVLTLREFRCSLRVSIFWKRMHTPGYDCTLVHLTTTVPCAAGCRHLNGWHEKAKCLLTELVSMCILCLTWQSDLNVPGAFLWAMDYWSLDHRLLDRKLPSTVWWTVINSCPLLYIVTSFSVS